MTLHSAARNTDLANLPRPAVGGGRRRTDRDGGAREPAGEVAH